MMGNEWGEAKHRKGRSPMDTGGRKTDPKTGRPERSVVTRWWESITKPENREPEGRREK